MGRIKPLAGGTKGRLVVVSNRGAYTIAETPENSCIKPSVSGMVSAVLPVLQQEGGLWIAWGGRYAKKDEVMGISLPLCDSDNRAAFQEVLLTPEEIDLYYGGFSNSCLWPLCHNFIEKTLIDEEQWLCYRAVNKKFSRIVLETTQQADYIWIHDFHLALMPGYIRQYRPKAVLSLFWHIPFPPVEIFSIIPWATDILRGLLNCEFIGFHTEGYVSNFLQCADELAGAEVDYRTGTVYWSGRRINVAAVPIGINYASFYNLACEEQTIRQAADIRQSMGTEQVILGLDRLDYTKGIPERLLAFEYLLENYPEYRRRVSFIQIAVPSRTDIPEYSRLKSHVDEIVGRINGKFTEGSYVPVRYFYRSFNQRDLVAYYLAADIALVTPLKDGMNLVAKEYIASKMGEKGVLLLSPFAGAAGQLKAALLANPYSPKVLAEQIVTGIKMQDAEKKMRMAELAKIVREQDINWWWHRLRAHWLDSIQPAKTMVPINEIWSGAKSVQDNTLNI